MNKKKIVKQLSVKMENGQEEGVLKLNEISLSKLIETIEDKDEKELKNHIKQIINQAFPFKEKYFPIFLYDKESSISNFMMNRIYSEIKKNGKQKDVIMFLLSPGGQIEPAYFISKVCKKNAKKNFLVTVPRFAKSAATLICLGADSIHMGDISHLGPIDPQFDNLPALGIIDSFRLLSQIVSDPDASYRSTMLFSEYLNKQIPIQNLGYSHRIPFSAVQYGERLLKSSNSQKAQEIAYKLVYEYKDHSFVIDVEEAKTIFGSDFIKENTVEYTRANDLYQFLDLLELALWVINNRKKDVQITLVGGIDSLNITLSDNK